jgi:hypothetical protein
MSNKMRLIQFITFLQAALHVSGVDTHQQELVQPEAVITAVPAPDDGFQQLKHVELPTEM